MTGHGLKSQVRPWRKKRDDEDFLTRRTIEARRSESQSEPPGARSAIRRGFLDSGFVERHWDSLPNLEVSRLTTAIRRGPRLPERRSSRVCTPAATASSISAPPACMPPDRKTAVDRYDRSIGRDGSSRPSFRIVAGRTFTKTPYRQLSDNRTQLEPPGRSRLSRHRERVPMVAEVELESTPSLPRSGF